MKKYLQNKYLGLFFCISFSFYLTFEFFTKEQIETVRELIEIKGPLESYSFKDGTGRKRMGHQYYIKLKNYSNQFQIKADYLGYFKAIDFMTIVQAGDPVTLTIPESQKEKLNSEGNAFVTSIRVKYTTYLSSKDVIEQEKSYILLYAAVAFIILGPVFFKLRGPKAKTTANT